MPAKCLTIKDIAGGSVAIVSRSGKRRIASCGDRSQTQSLQLHVWNGFRQNLKLRALQGMVAGSTQ
jgi:hypothetical protein